MAKSTKAAKKATMHDDVDPWERQPDESSEAFAAWLVYRDAEGKRTFKRVADELQKSTTLIYRWGTDYRWADRLRRWENHKDAVARAATLKAIVDFRKRAARQAMAKGQTIMLVDMALTGRLAELGNDPAKLLKDMSVNELMQLSMRGAQALPNILRAEALALGDSTDRAEVSEQRDTLSAQIQANPSLLSEAAALIEKASLAADA